jgi:Flp pilus assembly pilin Flp
MADLLRRIWSEDQAEDLAEYVLIVVVVGLGLIALVSSIEGAASTAFSEAVSAF